jgi:hypothetical protein
MTRIQRFAAGACSVAVTLALVTHAGAESLPSQTLDVTLLKSDAILFATIESLSQPNDHKDAVDLRLRDVRSVATRWPDALTGFRVRGRLMLDPDAGADVVIVPKRSAGDADAASDFVVVRNQLLTVGKRYLFLMRGGMWSDAPLLTSAPAIYLVSDGIVRCGSGNVYGIGTMGFVCDVESQTTVPPVTENQLFDALSRAISTARSRRSDVDAVETDAARTLEPNSALSWVEGN